MTTNRITLLEQKKAQWAKEKEELHSFSAIWPMTEFRYYNCRNRCSETTRTNFELNNGEFGSKKNQNSRASSDIFQADNGNVQINAEYDTSGYDSEADLNEVQIDDKMSLKKECSIDNDHTVHESDKRMRWKRNYDTNLTWLYTDYKQEPHLPDIKPSTPKWVQRNSNRCYLKCKNRHSESEIPTEREEKQLKANQMQQTTIRANEKERKIQKEKYLSKEQLDEKIKKQREMENFRVIPEVNDLKDERKKFVSTTENVAAKEKSKIISEQFGMELEDNDVKNNSFYYGPQNIRVKMKEVEIQTSDDYSYSASRKNAIDKSTQTTYLSKYLLQLRLKDNDKGMKELTGNRKPKWGINKPNVRYIKQSEKDQKYQQPKLQR